MAIAFGAESGRQVGVSVTSLTYAFSTAGSDRQLWVGALTTAGTITGVTYAGSAATQTATTAADAGVTIYAHGLIAPATGSNNVVVSTSATAVIVSHAVYYTGTHQTTLSDASGTKTGTGAFTHALTSIADNCWHILYCRNGASNMTAGTATTARSTTDDNMWFDSNAAKTPAGSVTLAVNSVTGAYGSIIISIAPTAVATTLIKTVNGLAQASVKTVDGLAIASVKTINGLSNV